MSPKSFLFVLVMSFVSSCVSVDQARYKRFANNVVPGGFVIDSAYQFGNKPKMIHNWVNFSDTITLENEYYTLWYQLDFKSKLKWEELRDTYVRITARPQNSITFDLIGHQGQLITSVKHKTQRYGDFVEIKPRTFFTSKFFLLNDITSKAATLALTDTGNLLVLDEIGGMVFFIVMPFGGSSDGSSYEYGPYVENE